MSNAGDGKPKITTEGGRVLIDGKVYVSIPTAAAISRVSADYITRLCRSGKVDAISVDSRSRVNPASLLRRLAAHPPEPDENAEVSS